MPIQIRIQLFTLMRIRSLLLTKVMRICDHWVNRPSTTPLWASTPPLWASTALHFEPLKILNFDINADPDPALQYNADLGTDPASKNNADPDKDAAYQIIRIHNSVCMHKATRCLLPTLALQFFFRTIQRCNRHKLDVRDLRYQKFMQMIPITNGRQFYGLEDRRRRHCRPPRPDWSGWRRHARFRRFFLRAVAVHSPPRVVFSLL